MSTKVLVVQSEFVRNFLKCQEGMIAVSEKDALSLLESGFFVDRDLAEVNENWRQIIPYVVMIDSGKVLLMKRTENQTEKRLHNLYSIGVGGHIEEGDGRTPFEAFWNGMNREIHEEVDADVKEMKFVGLINDLSSEVSRVHLGYMYLAYVNFREMREKDLFEWKLVPLEELEDYEEGMEGWSKIALSGLRSILMQK